MKTYKEFIEEAKVVGFVDLPKQSKEKISFSDLKKLEKDLDKIFSVVDIDIGSFGNHFKDRINDPRNKKEITIKELRQIFIKLFKQKKQELSNLTINDQKVLNSVLTKINIPFMVKFDKKENELSIVAKTIMRKDNFKTTNSIIKVK